MSVSITGSAVDYAGGGAGDITGSGNSNSGGTGGGGSYAVSGGGNAGTVNTGGGGSALFAGGSGIVILRVATSDYSGSTTGSPTVTTDGSDTIIKFTSSGTYSA